jgi:hypothetical protein
MSGKFVVKRSFLLLVLILVRLTGCKSPPQDLPRVVETLESLLSGLEALPPEAYMEEAFKRLALRDPEFVTRLGLADLYGVRTNALGSYDPEDLQMTLAFESGLLSLAMEYDQSAMNEAERLDLQAFIGWLEERAALHPYHG